MINSLLNTTQFIGTIQIRNKMCAAVDSSETFSGLFEESMTKRPIYTDHHHSEFAFHRYSLLRQKKILTDAVILSSDNKRFAWL